MRTIEPSFGNIFTIFSLFLLFFYFFNYCVRQKKGKKWYFFALIARRFHAVSGLFFFLFAFKLTCIANLISFIPFHEIYRLASNDSVLVWPRKLLPNADTLRYRRWTDPAKSRTVISHRPQNERGNGNTIIKTGQIYFWRGRSVPGCERIRNRRSGRSRSRDLSEPEVGGR